MRNTTLTLQYLQFRSVYDVLPITTNQKVVRYTRFTTTERHKPTQDLRISLNQSGYWHQTTVLERTLKFPNHVTCSSNHPEALGMLHVENHTDWDDYEEKRCREANERKRQRPDFEELLSGDWMHRISCTITVATIFCTWSNGGLRRTAVKKLGQASEDLVK